MKLEDAKSILKDSDVYRIDEDRKLITLVESSEVYVDDVIDWILEDAEDAIYKEVKIFENSIKLNFEGSQIVSLSPPDVEDVKYQSTRYGTSYSGNVEMSVKVQIPNKYMTGDSELDAAAVLDKVTVSEESILSSIEWDMKRYMPLEDKTAIIFKVTGHYSGGHER